MFRITENENENKFAWSSIGDIGEGRKNLGGDMPVLVYRLLEYTLRDVLASRFGNETMIDVFRSAGKLAGSEFSKNVLNLALPLNDFLAHLQNALETAKIGILRIEKFNPETGAATLTVSEDLDCSGLPVTGDVVCNYDEGFLAGVLTEYTHKDYIVTEVDCWASGSRVCRFEAHVRASQED
ncbi:MAG: V4R domain-containing protein [Ruthenibacterium sp.]